MDAGLSPPEPCSYLPDRIVRMRYHIALDLTAPEYAVRLDEGWRRFGPVLFRHECPSCRSCQSLRVPVATFRPSASQRRVWRRNYGDVRMEIAVPSISDEKLDLLAKFHRHGHQVKGWPDHGEPDLRLFVQNPFPTEEWSYYSSDRLVAIGYVDALPHGLSAIYFFHDPDEGHRSLGTFNILSIVDAARRRGLPYVHLGYFVEGCRSLDYKARFRPNQILAGGNWTSREP